MLARERASGPKTSHTQPRRSQDRGKHCIAKAGPSCCYCQQSHSPVDCTAVININTRKQILKSIAASTIQFFGHNCRSSSVRDAVDINIPPSAKGQLNKLNNIPHRLNQPRRDLTQEPHQPRLLPPFAQTREKLGSLYSVDWTTGLDYWTGLLDYSTVNAYSSR